MHLKSQTARSLTNPNHHLYINAGIWFIHYTVLPSNKQNSGRKRYSLKTKDLEAARRLRDIILLKNKIVLPIHLNLKQHDYSPTVSV